MASNPAITVHAVAPSAAPVISPASAVACMLPIARLDHFEILTLDVDRQEIDRMAG